MAKKKRKTTPDKSLSRRTEGKLKKKGTGASRKPKPSSSFFNFWSIDPAFRKEYPTLGKIPVINIVAQKMHRHGWWHSIGLLLVLGLFLGFGLNHLGKFFTTDEIVWLFTRGPQYFEAWSTGDLAKTNISANPGITHSILAGMGEQASNFNNYHPTEREDFLFWWRLPGLLFNWLSLIVIYVFINRLMDRNHALLITGLIAFTPMILGMSQIPNSDSTLWNTSFLSMLGYLLYLKTPHWKYVMYSGVFLGLAMLSKYPAYSVPLFLFAFLYLGYLMGRLDRGEFLGGFKGLGLLLGIAYGLLFIFYPAILVDSKLLAKKTIGFYGVYGGYILLFVIITFSEIYFFNGNLTKRIKEKLPVKPIIAYLFNLPLLLFLLILISYRLFIEEPFFLLSQETIEWESAFLPTFAKSINAIQKEVSIPVLIGLLSFLSISLFQWGRERLKRYYHLLQYMVLAILLYKFGTAATGVVSGGRYDIILFPVFAFIAGTVFLKIIPNPKIAIIGCLSLAIVDIVILTPLSYLTYNNDIYTNYNGRRYVWGLGGYEIAQKTNALPNSEKLYIMNDYHGFAMFFGGNNNNVNTPVDKDYLSQFDYLCLSAAGKLQKQNKYKIMTPDLLKYYEQPLEEAVFHVGSHEAGYVKLVKVDK